MNKNMKWNSRLIRGLCASALGLGMFATLALIRSHSASAQQPRPRPPIVIPANPRPSPAERPTMVPRPRPTQPPSVVAPMPAPVNSATQGSTPPRIVELARSTPTPVPEKTTPSTAAAMAVPNQNDRIGIGVLRIDIPDKVEVGTPFDMDIWIDFNDPNYSGSVDVFMEQTRKVLYEPRRLQIKPGDRSTMKVTIVKSPSGLAMIRASANGVTAINEPVDAGFSAKLKATNLDQPLVSGRATSVSFDFTNGQGQLVAIDAPLKLMLECPSVYFRASSKDDWHDSLQIDVPENSTATQAIQIKPRWLWSPDNGSLIVKAQIATEGGYAFVVHDETFRFNETPRWWLPLAMAIVGGIFFSFYQGTQDWIKSRDPKVRRTFLILITRVFPGALAGALAYFLVNMNVLGIKIDTTALQGFVVLGFLFAYVGIDTILKLVTKKSDDKTDKPRDQQLPAPSPS